MTCRFSEARDAFHAELLGSILTFGEKGVPTNADKNNVQSVKIAKSIFSKIGAGRQSIRKAAQTSGLKFEDACARFVERTFRELVHLRPGDWKIGAPTKIFKGRGQKSIAGFDQYEHLAALADLAKKNAQLRAALDVDYLIKPDVIIARLPEPDGRINVNNSLVDMSISRRTSLRKVNNETPILHASISCKWTLRSDRAQNARSEGLNLVKNRKGRLPHIAVITGEPTPARIASIALGTGEVDCVYHFALPELERAVAELKLEDASLMLQTMIDGRRLRDIADLPLDLAV
jgi:hypothetical protein